ncbi:MAG: DUF898 domain-containing protein [Betaproteobacteria bacterium]|nr:MAG: DUF898 domain-containing protein [Betaproteobacteria bacterium]
MNPDSSKDGASPETAPLELIPVPPSPSHSLSVSAESAARATGFSNERTADQGAELDPENNLMVLAPAARGNETVEALKFTGTAGEYFRVWIVNTFLVIVTLGLWSPWAKIRKRRFFLRNTWVAGANFDYHANPWPILRGRLIAGTAFIVYWFTGEINPNWAPWVALFVAVIAPWIVVSSLRFNLSNTSYRNLRFSFEGTLRDAVVALWPIWLVAVSAVLYPPVFDESGSLTRNALAGLAYFVFILFYPYLHGKMRLLVLNHSRYGHAPIACTTRIKTFYTIYLRGILVAIGLYVGAAIVAVVLMVPMLGGVMASGLAAKAKWLPVVIGVVAALPFACAGLVWYAFTQTRLINATFNLTTISTNVRVFSNIKTWAMAKLYIINSLAVIFSLGLAIPWAAVRTAKQRVETTALAVTSDFDDIIADAVPPTSATADAATEFFSLDIAL